MNILIDFVQTVIFPFYLSVLYKYFYIESLIDLTDNTTAIM